MPPPWSHPSRRNPGADASLALIAASCWCSRAAFVGWLSFYHGSTPLYATVISLVVPIVVTQLVFSGGIGPDRAAACRVELRPVASRLVLGSPGACLVALAARRLVFVRSDAGQLLVAIRDNEQRCAYLGLERAAEDRPDGLCAGVAGMAGFLYANAIRCGGA